MKLPQRTFSVVPSDWAASSTWCLLSGTTGAGEKLHMPTTSVVTPWRILELRGRALVVEEVGMRVDVDEAGRDGEPGGIDDVRRIGGKLRSDCGNAIAVNRHVERLARRTGAVDNGAVPDQQRPGHVRAQTPPGRAPVSPTEKCAWITRQTPSSRWNTKVCRDMNVSSS